MANLSESITDVIGIIAGHAQNETALTGCTVIICEKGAVGGVDQRGGAPGTRETDLLHPMHLVDKIHAVVLSGGSAFGLDAASGVMRFLEQKSVGFNTGVARVPIVPCAVLFDLALGNPAVRPDAEMGYSACLNATSTPLLQGNFGAGTGASVGKIFGAHQATKTGIGTASTSLSGGVIVSAVIAVNAFGDVVDPKTGSILAGARSAQKGFIRIGGDDYYANTMKVMDSFMGKTILNIASGHNTVIGAVVTNAKLNKEEANKVAQMAHNGIAVTIRPAHTMMDGDTIFTMATGEKNANVSVVGAFAAEVVARAIINAVKFAEPSGGLPSYQTQ
jgi:L-aminopeptidase/D-esterase-like protein